MKFLAIQTFKAAKIYTLPHDHNDTHEQNIHKKKVKEAR